MNNNKKIVLVIVGVIVLVGVFYGGMAYGKSQIPVRGQGAQAFGQNGVAGTRGIRNGGGLGGFTTGQIISKDAKSITVQLMTDGSASGSQGGSKIIFLGTNTTITKTATGSTGDLTIGAQVSVTGTANTDGSITAQSVQIRPNPVSAPSLVK
jgi:hypothetical protein